MQSVRHAPQFSPIQSLSHVWLRDRQASLPVTNSQSPPKLMSIESVMQSNHLILCHPLFLLPSVFPSIRDFSSESAFCIGGQSIGVSASASASVLPMYTQDCTPLGWTGWISLQSKGLSRVFSNTTVQKQITNKHMTRCPTSLVEKCKSKLQWNYHLTLVRMAIIKKSTNSKCWRGCGKKVTFLHCWWECKLI